MLFKKIPHVKYVISVLQNNFTGKEFLNLNCLFNKRKERIPKSQTILGNKSFKIDYHSNWKEETYHQMDKL
jgi:hypothetical protein